MRSVTRMLEYELFEPKTKNGNQSTIDMRKKYHSLASSLPAEITFSTEIVRHSK